MNAVLRAWELYLAESKVTTVKVPHRFFKNGVVIAIQEDMAKGWIPKFAKINGRPVPFNNWLEENSEPEKKLSFEGRFRDPDRKPYYPLILMCKIFIGKSLLNIYYYA